MRNDIYIHFDKPKLWSNENVIEAQGIKVIPDALFSVKGVQYFLEVDRLQKMNTNLEKLKQYKRFKDTGLWQKRNMGKFPIILFYTTKDSRKYQLQESNPGLDLQILTTKDLQ